MKNYICSIDTETLGVFDDSVVFTVGLCIIPFEKRNWDFISCLSNSIEIKLNAQDQIKNYGRQIDKDTLQWWKTQPKEAQEKLFTKDTDLKLVDLPKAIETFLIHKGTNWQDIMLFDRKSFDISKLEHIFIKNLGYKYVPWDYKEEYEFATLMTFLSGNRYNNIYPENIENMIYHSAKHDAALDAYRLMLLFNNIDYFA